MAAANYNDKRRDERDARFKGEYSLRLIASDSVARPIMIRPIDVSVRGLGFQAREPVKVGQFFTLVIGERRFRVEIAYCGTHLGIENLFRCGLFLREADGNLREACHVIGLLSDEHGMVV